MINLHNLNRSLYLKYAVTAWFYDLLDYPWERHYRLFRKTLLSDVHGNVLEAGVGTGRNLPYYQNDVQLTGIDLSPAMLGWARWRARRASCQIVALKQEDASVMSSIDSQQYDWLISTFMCCVMPDLLQPLAIAQFQRVLKPGGRFRILEVVYSKNSALRKRQQLFAKWAEKIYGARFDRPTLELLQVTPELQVERVRYLYADTHRCIEGRRIES